MESGDWVTPRLYGKPWFEKPPLFYWEAALSFKLFGVSEAAARLPSAVSALLATLALAWLAWRVYGAETARWLLLLLPTTVGMIGFSHAAATDMPFSAMLAIAMVAAAVVVGLDREANGNIAGDVATRGALRPSSGKASLSPAKAWVASICFGFFLGLAVLAKGPAGVILCGGSVFFWAVCTKRWRDAFRLFHPAAIAAFCATALPWYVLCARRNPDFFRVFIIEHNFKRYLTPEFQHIQPFWYYGEILLIAFLPWTAALLWTLIAGSLRSWQARKLSGGIAFLVSWAGFCVAFFTISQSKLPGYVLPAVPAIGLILAVSCTHLAPAKPRSFGLSVVGTALLFVGAFLVLRDANSHPLKKLIAFQPLVALLFFLLALSGLLLGAGFMFRRDRSLQQLALAISVLPIVITLASLPAILSSTPISVVSPRALAREIQADGIPLANLRTGRLARSTLYGLNFYLETSLQDWDRDPTQEVFLLTEEKDVRSPCRERQESMTCLDLWAEQKRLDTFHVLRLTPKR